MISFCTTCANRAAQLKQTFAENAAVLAAEPDIEWVILNYGSTDDLDEFMRTQLPRQTGRLVYAQAPCGTPWHSSVAKNVAHSVGTRPVLFNLDCDNFIGDSVPVVRRYFRGGCQLLHQWSGVHRDGTYGRIALTRELLGRLGGYDESFYPMAYQDGDLLARASALNVPVIRHTVEPELAIKNTKEESILLCRREGLEWGDFDRFNRMKSAANIAAGCLAANQDRIARPRELEVRRGELP